MVEPGAREARDAPLLIVEAMKMEHTVRAPRPGLLQAFRVRVGDQVAMGELLVDLDEAAAGAA
jgi:3-methylcrotonyl-CoA carboxylase alpha subunit